MGKTKHELKNWWQMATLPRVIGDDYTNLAKLTPSATITYAVTDGVPIVTGTTSNQQYWN